MTLSKPVITWRAKEKGDGNIDKVQLKNINATK
jgi:hypothetical protein